MSEIIELRTENAKTFNLGGNDRRIEASPSPKHYKDSKGDWQDIVTDIVVDTVNRSIYIAKLLPSEIGYEVTNKEDGKKSIVKLIDIEGVTPTYSKPIITGNEAKWVDIVPNVDLMIVFYETKIRTWRLLKTNTAPKKIKWNVEEDEVIGDMVFLQKIWGIDDGGLETISSRIASKSTTSKSRTTSEYEDTFDEKVFELNPTTRVKSESTNVTYPVLIDADIDVKPTASADDGVAIKTASGSQSLNIANTIVRIRHWSYYGSPVGEKAFTRFPGITIPQGSNITLADYKYYAVAGTTNPILTVVAKNLNNPAAPTNFAQVWSPNTLTTNGYVKTLASTVNSYITSDLIVRVQGLVDSFDYSNDAMLFFINPKVATTNVFKTLMIKQFDSGTSSQYPNLIIHYTVVGGGAVDDEGNNFIM